LSWQTDNISAALRLNGVDTKNHAIFTELSRVRQYMEKIQKLENPPPEREKTVNTEATARFLRSDLVCAWVAPTSILKKTLTSEQADNKDIKAKLSELIAREREKAAAKAAAEKKRPAEDSAATDSSAAETGPEKSSKRQKHKGNKKKR
jgi:exosome complex protein LRP1